VTNAGDISGQGGVAAVGSPGIVTNSGAITGTKVGSTFFFAPITLGDGVFMNAGGAVTNKVGGTITGAGDGVYVAGGGAVTNTGTISGTTASVRFAGGGANTLTLKTGSTLIGDAIGSTASGATNALVLKGAGRTDNNFENFNTLKVNGDWTLGGTSSFGGATISSGASLDDAGALTITGTSALEGSKIIISSGDTLTMNGTTALSGKVLGAGTLAFTGGSATLNSGASLSVAGWTVSGSGTTVTLDENLSYAGSFSEGAGDTFVLSEGHLLLDGVDTFTGGTVDGSHVLETKAATTVSGLTIGGTVEWENEGTVTQSGGSATIGDASGDTAFLDNTSRGTYDITDDSGVGLGSSTASYIQSAGLFEKTGGTGMSAIAPAVTNTGTIEVTAGTLDLHGAVIGRGTDKVSGASTIEFDSTVAATQTVEFLGGPSAVDLLDPNGFSGKIARFGSPDTVQLSGDWVFSSFSENAAGTLGTLTLASGASHHAFNFVGDYTASDFKIASGATTTIGHT
jgi:fibronectin-binding autotransporter adhesin